MRSSALFIAACALPYAAAHSGIPGMPKILGLAHRDIAALKSRNIFEGHAARPALAPKRELVARQGGNAQNRCGPEFGCASCDDGYCCSPSGWCGKGEDYCESPDCLFNYGPGCDANYVPAGGSTLSTDRSAKGGQPMGGEGVRSCVVPGTVSITYDDGPWLYTDALLTLLAKYSAKATFFITGNNLSKRPIDETAAWKTVIQRMDAEGHQIASHIWTHEDLNAITSKQRYDQLLRNEMALTNILGKFPVYMRPPYSRCDAASGCQADMAALGYVISSFDLDTDDYDHQTLEGIQIAKDNVYDAMNGKSPASANFLSIAHDIHELTAVNLTGYMLDYISKQGYKMVTLAECLGVNDKKDWYRTPSSGSRTASTSSFAAPPLCLSTTSVLSSATASLSAPTTTPTLKVSTDASCGGTGGFTCTGFMEKGNKAECCSASGWCGNTAPYCGTGCQAGFGKCGPENMLGFSSSITPSSSSIVSSAASSSTIVSSAPASSSPASSSAAANVISSSTHASSSTIASSSAITQAASSSLPAVQPSPSSSSIRPSYSSIRPSSSSSIRPSSSSARPSASTVPAAPISKDGSCGGTKGYTCTNSTFGACCSQNGWCGASTAHCGAGCNTAFGTCTAQPVGGKPVSPDGSCGGAKGYTCSGSAFGTCCSASGWCGGTTAYCKAGCQAGFGTCT